MGLWQPQFRVSLSQRVGLIVHRVGRSGLTPVHLPKVPCELRDGAVEHHRATGQSMH